MTAIRKMTCPLCEAMCGLRVQVEDQRITSIRADPDDPLSQGAICPKAVALRDLHEDTDRLRRPLKKVGNRHVEVDWSEAIDEVAEKLIAIRKTHGSSSVASYTGNPMTHNAAGILFSTFFNRALRSKRVFSATSLDQLPHMIAAYSMFGHQLLLPIPDIDRTDLMVIIGANPVVSNGSIMSAPGMRRRLQNVRGRGGRVIVIDPRRTETARVAGEHLFIRPGTDALFLFALVRTLFEDIGPRLGHLDEQVVGLDQARRLAEPFTPEAVEGPTGVPADATRDLAQALAHTERGVVYGRVGLCTQAFGGLAGWLLNLTNLLAGNLDRPGGAMFPKPAIDTLRLAAALGRAGSFDRYRSQVRDLPEFGGELPTVVLAEEIETTSPDRIRALVTAAGNPVLSSPGGTQLERALGRLELMVSIDPYLNETTRFADYILPPVSALERDHYDLIFHTLSVRNTSKFSPALFEPPEDSMHDWEIFRALTIRIEKKLGAPIQAGLNRLVMSLGPRRMIDLGLRAGPYPLSLSKLRKAPSGVDLGPLESCLPRRLFTPNKKIEAAPSLYQEDVGRLRSLLGSSTLPADLVLIGRRELRSNNSWMHNAPTLIKGPPRCTLRMHPDDAAARHLSSGDAVRLSREDAREAVEVMVTLEISDELMPGVVSLPHGYGHSRPGTRLRQAQRLAGVSINDVLDPRQVDELTGTAVLNGQRVQVTRV